MFGTLILCISLCCLMTACDADIEVSTHYKGTTCTGTPIRVTTVYNATTCTVAACNTVSGTGNVKTVSCPSAVPSARVGFWAETTPCVEPFDVREEYRANGACITTTPINSIKGTCQTTTGVTSKTTWGSSGTCFTAANPVDHPDGCSSGTLWSCTKAASPLLQPSFGLALVVLAILGQI